VKASEIASIVEGTLEGAADPELTGVAPLDRAGPEELTFLARPRYLPYLERARAGAILIASELADRGRTPMPRIVVRDVHRALALVLARLYPEEGAVPGVHPTARLGEGIQLGQDVEIGAYAVVEAGVRIGDRARVGAHCFVGRGCTIADDVLLHPHVTMYAGVEVGRRSILHSGVRAGVDGFGYVFVDGGHRKIPQVGRCVIGEDVEIGANTTIDRGSVGSTEIGNGVKIDNLVHIGHNVRVGDHSVIVAQVGISGSTTIGRGVTLAGQAGLQGHISVGDGATIGGQAGVFDDVPAGAIYSGYPARPHKEAMRAQASLFRLPALLKRLRELERVVFGRGKVD
jgi:UDP-3-O-[3-hydroxymyristoyl] glucosamine N-acyltransferase